jgi:hypothetical protein
VAAILVLLKSVQDKLLGLNFGSPCPGMCKATAVEIINGAKRKDFRYLLTFLYLPILSIFFAEYRLACDSGPENQSFRADFASRPSFRPVSPYAHGLVSEALQGP